MPSKAPLLKRFLHQVGNKGDLSAIKRHASAHFVEHGETPPSVPRGTAQLRAYFEDLRRGIPDLTVRFDDVFEAGDKVVARTTWTGTHDGELFGIPPTGRAVSFQAIDIVRFEGKKMVERWSVTDRGPLMMHLGVPASQNVWVPQGGKARRAARRPTRVRTSRAASRAR